MKIIVPIVCALFLFGCNDTAPTEKASSVQTNDAIDKDVNAISAPTQPSAVVAQTAAEATAQTTPNKVDPTQTQTKPVKEIEAEPKKEVKAEPKAKAVKEVTPKTEIQSKNPGIDGSALFGNKCASCHGAKAEKPALGKSQVIAGWKASQVEEALNGYQSGSYGKEMKAVMQGQAKSLTSEEIKSLARYISQL